MKHHIPLVAAWALFGCESPPPEPSPPEPNLAVEVARLGDALSACMRAENDRLRAERDALKAKIDAKLKEVSRLAEEEAARAPKRRP